VTDLTSRTLPDPLRSVKPLLFYSFTMLLIWLISRLGLVLWQLPRVWDARMLPTIFIQGLRFDFVALGGVLLLPAVLTPLCSLHHSSLKAWRSVLMFYLALTAAFIVFMEIATPAFIGEYDTRPNILFFEYLKHPREVFQTLWHAYTFQLLIATAALPLTAWLIRITVSTSIRQLPVIRGRQALWMAPLLFIVCGMMVRSTFDHRAVNPSTVAISSDPMVNSLALNSFYTSLYALYELRHEPDAGFHYAEMPEDRVIETVRAEMKYPVSAFTEASMPTLHHQDATVRRARPLNLVIVLEESLGAEFVGSLGGLPLTPKLDELTKQGWWFENLYATGTRSVRGIEAVITGFPPTPASSVVKLGKSQNNFFTLASLLDQYGYHCSFIYGGEAQFDNMRRFFMNNGFESVVDEKDYKNPVFTGSWGVSDEDLFNKADEQFSAAGDRPFFSLVFSSSNHIPFQYPDGRIEPYDKEKNTVNNAVKYADYALGGFIEKARRSNYWKNTLFLIVADHNSRVYGAEILPVKRFHIPALILGADIKPAVHKPVASQIDLAPTVLSLMGISSTHPMIGHDLTRPEFQAPPGRALMQFYNTLGYMEGDKVALLRKDLPASYYTYADGVLVPAADIDQSLIDKAIAHSLWASIAYEKKLYRWPLP
jgi:phosphoglycerol transferase MdoB-like AlkP superfamily enzyme